MRHGLVTLAAVAFPFIAVAAPMLPKGFAPERLKPVASVATLPAPVRRAVDRYIWFAQLSDVGAHIGGRGCIRSPGRRLVLAGVGRTLEFVVYEHGGGGMVEHDHLVVFGHDDSGMRTVAFSCVGTLPRQPAKLRAAIVRGQCVEASGAVEPY